MKAIQILAELDMGQGTASKKDIRKAWYLSDDEGTLQAEDAFELFRDPLLHKTMSLREALKYLGCEDDV